MRACWLFPSKAKGSLWKSMRRRARFPRFIPSLPASEYWFVFEFVRKSIVFHMAFMESGGAFQGGVPSLFRKSAFVFPGRQNAMPRGKFFSV